MDMNPAGPREPGSTDLRRSTSRRSSEVVARCRKPGAADSRGHRERVRWRPAGSSARPVFRARRRPAWAPAPAEAGSSASPTARPSAPATAARRPPRPAAPAPRSPGARRRRRHRAQVALTASRARPPTAAATASRCCRPRRRPGERRCGPGRQRLDFGGQRDVRHERDDQTAAADGEQRPVVAVVADVTWIAGAGDAGAMTAGAERRDELDAATGAKTATDLRRAQCCRMLALPMAPAFRLRRTRTTQRQPRRPAVTAVVDARTIGCHTVPTAPALSRANAGLETEARGGKLRITGATGKCSRRWHRRLVAAARRVDAASQYAPGWP